MHEVAAVKPCWARARVRLAAADEAYQLSQQMGGMTSPSKPPAPKKPKKGGDGGGDGESVPTRRSTTLASPQVFSLVGVHFPPTQKSPAACKSPPTRI